MTGRCAYSTGTALYRLDPYTRDERGRFVPKPDVPPAPLALLTGAQTVSAPFPALPLWLVRVIVRDGAPSVVISEVA